MISAPASKLMFDSRKMQLSLNLNDSKNKPPKLFQRIDDKKSIIDWIANDVGTIGMPQS